MRQETRLKYKQMRRGRELASTDCALCSTSTACTVSLHFQYKDQGKTCDRGKKNSRRGRCIGGVKKKSKRTRTQINDLEIDRKERKIRAVMMSGKATHEKIRPEIRVIRWAKKIRIVSNRGITP